MGGDDSQKTTESYTPYNQGQIDELLGMGRDWLRGGGIQQGTDYSGEMRNSLETSKGFYEEMMSGDINRKALADAQRASADATQTNFERNIMPSIGTASNLTGSQASSRRGIAEGLAASDMNAQIAQTNAQMEWQAEQDLMNRRMAGAQGIGNLMSGYNALSEYETGRENSYLDSLLAYSNMVSSVPRGGTTVSNTKEG